MAYTGPELHNLPSGMRDEIEKVRKASNVHDCGFILQPCSIHPKDLQHYSRIIVFDNSAPSAIYFHEGDQAYCLRTTAKPVDAADVWKDILTFAGFDLRNFSIPRNYEKTDKAPTGPFYCKA